LTLREAALIVQVMVTRSVAVVRAVHGAALCCLLALGCAKERTPPESFAATRASVTPASVAKPAEPTLDLKQACTDICEHSRVLKCEHAERCLTNCVAAAAGTPCNPEFQTFYRCLLKEPVRNWECAEDGVAAIREGFCDKEQARAVSCMQEKAAH
jgi:hypothetical protein